MHFTDSLQDNMAVKTAVEALVSLLSCSQALKQFDIVVNRKFRSAHPPRVKALLEATQVGATLLAKVLRGLSLCGVTQAIDRHAACPDTTGTSPHGCMSMRFGIFAQEDCRPSVFWRWKCSSALA